MPHQDEAMSNVDIGMEAGAGDYHDIKIVTVGHHIEDSVKEIHLCNDLDTEIIGSCDKDDAEELSQVLRSTAFELGRKRLLEDDHQAGTGNGHNPRKRKNL
jgi:hypothetical protein